MDYAALATQFGGTSQPAAAGGGTNYAALAKQFGGTSQPAPTDTAAPAPVQPDNRDLLSKASDFITNNNLPGAQLGKTIGKSIAGIGGTLSRLFKGDTQGAADFSSTAAQDVNKDFLPTTVDVVQSAVTPAAAIITGPAGAGFGPAAARVGVNAGLGAILGGASAAANGAPAADVGVSALAGGALGGGLSVGGEALNAALNGLPNRLIRGVLPKLKPGTEADALKRIDLGTLSSNIKANEDAKAFHHANIQNVLTKKYAGNVGEGAKAAEDTLAKYSNSEIETPADLALALKSVAPKQAKLVDKLVGGTATLAEKNELRHAIDENTYKQFGDLPKMTFSKEIAHEVANNLRSEVQRKAPETATEFQNYAKEINLGKALKAAKKTSDNRVSRIGLYDVLSASAGLLHSGPFGALLGFGMERAARSPTVGLNTAKGFKSLSRILPAVNKTARGLKGPLLQRLGSGSQPPAQ